MLYVAIVNDSIIAQDGLPNRFATIIKNSDVVSQVLYMVPDTTVVARALGVCIENITDESIQNDNFYLLFSETLYYPLMPINALETITLKDSTGGRVIVDIGNGIFEEF